jgi:hypothetical protein
MLSRKKLIFFDIYLIFLNKNHRKAYFTENDLEYVIITIFFLDIILYHYSVTILLCYAVITFL